MINFVIITHMTEELILIEKLNENHVLSEREWVTLLSSKSLEGFLFLQEKARATTSETFHNNIYIRGLIEFTNICQNDCYYCGIRKSNAHVSPYRLSKQEILSCCREGYQLGFRTFVLQGGEDPYYTDAILVDIISNIRQEYPDCAITLSIGERSRDSYKRLYEAGANRYLLRHETACEKHYSMLHPKNQSYVNRITCLHNLKEIGYQVGAGFMVGSPGQTVETLAKDMIFLSKFQPHMVGIGPFIPHRDTPLTNYPAGSVSDTLYLLSLIRLTLPKVLLPATTALATLNPTGRQQGVLSGANVVMPNLTPSQLKDRYTLYDHKLSSGAESADGLELLKQQMAEIGYRIVENRGDSPMASV